MPTINIPVTSAWTKVADASNAELLLTWNSAVILEVATTAADAVPTVNGHRLNQGNAVTRGVMGAGFVWVREVAGSVPASINVVVTK